MALALTDLFTDLTEIRDVFDEINGKYSGLATAKNAVVSRLDTAGYEDIIGQSEAVIATLYDALDAACNSYATFCRNRFIHRLMRNESPGLVISVGLPDAQILELLLVELWDAMTAQSKTVKLQTVTVGAITATKVNANAGSCTVTRFLPGNIAPTVGGVANRNYFDIETELAKTDSVVVRCVADSQSGLGLARGSEEFTVSGLPAAPGPFSARYSVDGDGMTRTLTPIQGRSVFHLGFDIYTVADTPDDWTIDGGAAGTEINEEATAAKVVGGVGSALAVTGTCSLYRPILPTEVKGRSQMCLQLLLRKDGASAGTYTISVTGTGFTTVTTGALNASALTTTYQPLATPLRIPVPASVPSDFRVNIDTSGISGGTVLIDQGGFAEYEWWNGVGIAMYEGNDPFTRGDQYTFAITNDYVGDAQTTLAKVFRAQMRSVAAGWDYA